MANQDAIRKYYAESGQQSVLDQLNATSGWGAVEADYNKRQTAPTVPTTTPTSFSSASAVGGGSSALASQYGSLDRYMAETGKQSTLDQIRATPGGYEKANAEFMSGKGQFATSTPGGSMASITPQATIDLPSIYQSLYQSSGISDLEKSYSDKEKQFIEAKGSLNDNPFLSEASRAGKEATLTKLFGERTANLKNDIATKKADIETQLNLQMKQLDINSQAATQALNQFNTLLSAGALDNASGEDIANFTRSTGIPSSMIQSAIQASVKAKEKKEEVSTQLITSTADSGEVTTTLINTQTGEIISQKSLGNVGNAQTAGGSTSSTKNAQSQFLEESKTIEGKNVSGQWWGQFPQLVAKYASYMSLEEIYKLYLQSDLGKLYGSPTENAKEMKELYDYSRSGEE